MYAYLRQTDPKPETKEQKIYTEGNKGGGKGRWQMNQLIDLD